MILPVPQEDTYHTYTFNVVGILDKGLQRIKIFVSPDCKYFLSEENIHIDNA